MPPATVAMFIGLAALAGAWLSWCASSRRAAIPAQQAAKGIRPLAPDAATPIQPPRTTNYEQNNDGSEAEAPLAANFQ